MKGFIEWVVELFGGPVVRVPVLLPDRRLDDSELRNALANARDSAVWNAVMQVLLDNYQSVQAQVSVPQAAQDAGALAHAVGGMSYLGQAIGELQDRANGARRDLEERAMADARRAAAAEVSRKGR